MRLKIESELDTNRVNVDLKKYILLKYSHIIIA